MTIFSGNREACSQAFSLLPKKGERRRSAHRRPSCARSLRQRADHAWPEQGHLHDRCRVQGDRCGTV